MNWLDRLFGRHEPAPEVQEAMDKRDQDFADLDDALADVKTATWKVDRLKNGIIRDYEQAEKGIKGRP